MSSSTNTLQDVASVDGLLECHGYGNSGAIRVLRVRFSTRVRREYILGTAIHGSRGSRVEIESCERPLGMLTDVEHWSVQTLIYGCVESIDGVGIVTKSKALKREISVAYDPNLPLH